MNTRKILIFICLFILLITIISCSPKGSENSEVLHPIKHYMPHHDKIIQTKSINDITELPSNIFLTKIPTAKKLFALGRKYGKQSEIFGDITAITSDKNQYIYILDKRTTTIRKYDQQGNLLTYYGGTAGRGPEDLFRPTDIEIDENGRIYVADGFNYIKILQSNGTNINYIGAIKTPKIIPSDICVLNDKIFLRTIAENKMASSTDSIKFNLVHVYSLKDHSYIGAFGKLYDSPRLRTNQRISGRRAKIACVESTNTIVYTFDSLGFIYGYSPEGQFKWATELNPFSSPKIIETVQGGIDVRWQFFIYGTKISNIQPLNDGNILAQGWYSEENSSPKLMNYLISTVNGKGYFLNQTIPYISHINEKFFFVGKADSTISVTVYQY